MFKIMIIRSGGARLVTRASDGSDALDVQALLAQCRQQMPAYRVPHGVEPMRGPLPRNPNGKIDRKLLATQWGEGQAG